MLVHDLIVFRLAQLRQALDIILKMSHFLGELLHRLFLVLLGSRSFLQALLSQLQVLLGLLQRVLEVGRVLLHAGLLIFHHRMLLLQLHSESIDDSLEILRFFLLLALG